MKGELQAQLLRMDPQKPPFITSSGGGAEEESGARIGVEDSRGG